MDVNRNPCTDGLSNGTRISPYVPPTQKGRMGGGGASNGCSGNIVIYFLSEVIAKKLSNISPAKASGGIS